MGRKTIVGIVLTLMLLATLCTTFNVKYVTGWSNGGYGGAYGTHDWIAQHALDWLPDNEKGYILEHMDVYLYGTELPDRSPPEGYGDSVLHHIYYWANRSLQDDASAVRAREMYDWAVTYVHAYHNISGAVMCLGIMSHYIVDVGVFGHVMGSGTDWGQEIHHEDYETYVNERTNSYEDEFNTYLSFDGALPITPAYNATCRLAYDTTFDLGDFTCVWMDLNYNWENINFKNKCGQSLNLCVNLLADVLHTFYEQVMYTGYSAAFIYSTNLDSAQSYESLLEANGVMVDLVPKSSAETWDYSSYGSILIGDDTGLAGTWDPVAVVSVINSAGKPILGLGEGGYAFFGKLALHIGYPNGAHAYENKIYVIDPGHQIFNYPTVISIPLDRMIQLYYSTPDVSIYLPSPIEGVTPLGRESPFADYYTLIQEATRYVLWGFSNAPADMTQTGKDLFVNVILWLLYWATPGSTRYPWPMFHHDSSHTGHTESPAPQYNNTLWSYPTGNTVYSSPAVADSRVYVGSTDRQVYCLDASTGTSIWNYTTDGAIYCSPGVANGRVYIGSNDKNVYCLDASDGRRIWNYTTRGSVESSPVVVDGKVYVGSYDGKVYCLDASTGTSIWNYTTDSCVASSPAVANGRVFVGSYDCRVYCLDAQTGEYIWNYTTASQVYSSPAVADGKVFVGSTDHTVYALDEFTGTHIWNCTTGNSVNSSPAFADGRVYVGSYDSRVYCLDASTGTQIWNKTTGGFVLSSPTLADGRVFVGSTDHKVYCLDALTGALIWPYETLGWMLSSPTIADGVGFVGSDDNKIYAFGDIIKVPQQYDTIQGAIDAAAPGATIWISPGVYHESIVINKPLTILGIMGSAPVFGGGGSGIAVTVSSTASGSSVAGIVITDWDQGILINNAANCKIYDNIMSLMVSNGIAIQGMSAINNYIYSNIFQSNPVAISLIGSSSSTVIYKNIITSNNVGLSLQCNGNIVYGNTIAENNAGIDVSSSSNNVIYHNNFDNYIENAITGGLNNVWDNGYPSGGNYWSSYSGVDDNHGFYQDIPGSDGIGDTQYTIAVNNVDGFPLMRFFNPHDIGVANIIVSKNIVGQGYPLSIEVKILNYGMYDEVFTVTVYANTAPIGMQTIVLAKRNSGAFTFIWDTSGFVKGSYTIEAYASPVQDEADTMDNRKQYGTVQIAMQGDFSGDGTVDGSDFFILLQAWGTSPPSDPRADGNCDGLVDGSDFFILLQNWGRIDP